MLSNAAGPAKRYTAKRCKGATGDKYAHDAVEAPASHLEFEGPACARDKRL